MDILETNKLLSIIAHSIDLWTFAILGSFFIFYDSNYKNKMAEVLAKLSFGLTIAGLFMAIVSALPK